MEISEVTVRLLLIFFPGIICAMIMDALTVHRERKLWSFLLNSFVLGLGTYILTFALWQLVAPCRVTIMESLLQLKANGGKEDLAVMEIVAAILVSIPLALGVSYASNHKVLHRLAQWLRVTKKFGDLDVWGYLFNSDIPEWVVIRDLDQDLAHEGWVQAFSDTADENELFLRDVRVLNNTTGDELYCIWGLYLAKPRQELTIEFTGLEMRPRPPTGREANSQEGEDEDHERR